MPITVQQKAPTKEVRQTTTGKTFQQEPKKLPTIISGGLHAQPGLVAQYDSRYINGLESAQPTNESQISQWDDISGNGNHVTQATEAFKPYFRSGNNRNLLTYNQATGGELGNTTGFTSRGGVPTLARNTTFFTSGLSSVSATATATNNCGVGTTTVGSTVGGVPGTVGQTYTAHAMVRTSRASLSGTFYLIFIDSGGNQLTFPSTAFTANNTGWTKVTISGTASAGTAFVGLTVDTSSIAIGDVVYVDEFGIWAGTSTTWVPPSNFANGLPSVQFLGGLSGGGLTTVANVPMSGTSTTVYAVCSPDTLISRSTYVSWTSSGIQGRMSLVDDGGSQMQGGLNVSNDTFAGVYPGIPDVPQAWQVISGVWGASNYNVRWNVGGTLYTASSGSVIAKGTSGQIAVGRFDAAPTAATANICAILIYSVAHDTTTRQQIEQSLGQIYGITVA